MHFSLSGLYNTLLKVDSLSAFFILIISFTTLTGTIFAKGYLANDRTHRSDTSLSIHYFSLVWLYFSMVFICMVQDSLGFLIGWELMGLSSFLLVIYRSDDKEVLVAGINYLVQMHISFLFLLISFLYVQSQTGFSGFEGLTKFSQSGLGMLPFYLFFTGFAIKAGFVPFHTWLPKAHPAAPSHVSGIMSGVIVKVGIYGILRVITCMHSNWLFTGQIILTISIITTIYGIANAALKDDYKRMLAYCTIENIGIIGLGIGIGLIGIGLSNMPMEIMGFSAAFFHTLNHSLYKSLLFYSSGSVYSQTHTRIIDKLGGLIKKMPLSAMFFLIGGMAICGLPPFNGFISEYLLYSGLFKGLISMTDISQIIILVLTVAGLAFAGGISLLTFTKNFGIIFLGNPRKQLNTEPRETGIFMQLPQFMIIAIMLSIAIFPQFYFHQLVRVTESTFSLGFNLNDSFNLKLMSNMGILGQINLLIIGILAITLGARWLLSRNKHSVIEDTWSCGYAVPISKAQYSGRSFASSFAELFSFLAKTHKDYRKISKTSIYPEKRSFKIAYFDLVDRYLLNPISRRLYFFLNYFQFIQNGKIQSYLIYGLVFIMIVFLGTILKLIQ